jgi:hypothetical protein
LPFFTPLEWFKFEHHSSAVNIAGEKEKTLKSQGFQGFGGDKRDRTADILNAMAPFSNLLCFALYI